MCVCVEKQSRRQWSLLPSRVHHWLAVLWCVSMAMYGRPTAATCVSVSNQITVCLSVCQLPRTAVIVYLLTHVRLAFYLHSIDNRIYNTRLNTSHQLRWRKCRKCKLSFISFHITASNCTCSLVSHTHNFIHQSMVIQHREKNEHLTK